MLETEMRADTADRIVETCLPVAIIFFVLASLVILTALGFEHIGGYQPCALCLLQRIPYYVAIPVSAVTLLAIWFAAGRALVALLFIALLLIMLYSTGLATYHSGVEWGLLEGPAGCAPAGGNPQDVSSVLSGLQSGQVEASCTEAVWRLFGLSFAGWNAVFSLILASMAFVGAKRAIKASERSL